MRDVTLYSVKKKSVHSCRLVHHTKFHCIMAMLNKLFKFEFERAGGTGKEPFFFFTFTRGWETGKEPIDVHARYREGGGWLVVWLVGLLVGLKGKRD